MRRRVCDSVLNPPSIGLVCMLDQPTGMSLRDMTYQRSTAYANVCSLGFAVAIEVAGVIVGAIIGAVEVGVCVATVGAVAVEVGV